MVKISAVITTYNYSKYLKQCVDSVLNQTQSDYEIIIVDDASTDNIEEVLKQYEGRKNIRIIRHSKNQGLIKSCDEAIKESGGEYIIRLDADDYFDENALLILSGILDRNPGVGLVYSDYFKIRDDGNIIEYVRWPKLGKEDKVMDMPANGAGCMFRRSCYDAIGGYNKNVKCQDGLDLWIKITNKFKVLNINLPLFYYRKHDLSMSSDNNFEKKQDSRRIIKDEFVQNNFNKDMKVLGIIPARAKFDFCDMLPLRELCGKPLIAYSIEEAKKSKYIDKVVVVTESKKIADVAREYEADVIMRPARLSDSSIPIGNTVFHVLNKLKESGYVPDAVAALYLLNPLRTHESINEAINTLIINNVDSVISVCEDMDLHYQHGPYGMRPLFEKRLMRKERESLFKENGAVYISKLNAIKKNRLLGKKIGHILMGRKEGLRVDNPFDFWLAEQILKSRCKDE